MTHREFLSSSRVFGCKVCRTHLATIDALMSRVRQWCGDSGDTHCRPLTHSYKPVLQNFNGQSGRAFLFESVVNIGLGEAQDRHMTTGLHTVRDIHCGKCSATLGWKYVSVEQRWRQTADCRKRLADNVRLNIPSRTEPL